MNPNNEAIRAAYQLWLDSPGGEQNEFFAGFQAASAAVTLSDKQIKEISSSTFAQVQAMPDDEVDGDTWDRCFARNILASSAPAIPQADGYKLVPVEPTEAMVHAAEDVPPPRMFGAVYRAMIAAASDIPQADERPRQWVESEESMRGAPLHIVLQSDCVTVIWHSRKPITSNPVWEVIGQ